MRTRAAALLAAAALAAGCQGVPMDLSGVTPTDRAQIDPYGGQQLTAEASGFQLVLFIPLGVNDRHKRALDDLRRQAGNRLLGQVTVTESWTYAFIGTVYTTRVQAMAYPRKAPAAPGR